MLRSLAFVVCGALITTSATAQVIYLPVQSQYHSGRGTQTYFYGGSDPRVHEVARREIDLRVCGVGNTHNFDGGNSFGQPSPLSDTPQPVFTDNAPFQEASRFGYSRADARNEAFSNSPTYFRKADLLNSAIRYTDGSITVPASQPRGYVAPSGFTSPMRSYGVPPRGQVIIIPRRLLDRPVKDFDSKPLKVASISR